MHFREDTSCFSLKWKNQWLGLEHEQFDEALLVVMNCIDCAGISCLWLSPSCTGCRPGRVAKWRFVITPVSFFGLDGWSKPFSASGNFYILWKTIYATVFRFTVMTCVSVAVVGGKLRFLSGRPRDFWHGIFRHSFCFRRRELLKSFLRLQQFWERFLLMGVSFLFPFKSCWFRSWRWELLLTRHCSHCLLVKNKGGCSFGLFNYDSFVSFRAIGVIWSIWELTAELVCLLFWTLFLVPIPWETNNQDMKIICTWTARE